MSEKCRSSNLQVSYPLNLFQASDQNITVTFPKERVTIQNVTLTLSSKLLVENAKGTFTIEDDSEDVPCSIREASTTRKILSLRLPPEAKESFVLNLKGCTVKLLEKLRLVFNYGVQSTESGYSLYTVFPQKSI